MGDRHDDTEASQAPRPLLDIAYQLSGLGALAGFALVIAAPVILLGRDFLLWLQSERWSPLSNQDALLWLNLRFRPTTSWIGLRRLVAAALDAPLMYTAMVAGAVAFYGCIRLLKITEPTRRRGPNVTFTGR